MGTRNRAWSTGRGERRLLGQALGMDADRRDVPPGVAPGVIRLG
jgi:hypothetical protein